MIAAQSRTTEEKYGKRVVFMAEERAVRDPIHGFVYLRSKEAEIVGSALFQRLRGIRQLAFAHLVYPGAHHTRFEHSLGVCNIVGRLAKSVGLKTEDEQLVRLAALLHDIGHGPFSHVSEDALEIYAEREKLGDRLQDDQASIHELVTQDFIRNDPDLKRLLGEHDCQRIATLLAEGYDEPLLRSLVSGPLDGDKQDYLLRDSHYCGVKYGVFDLDQMHRSLVAHDPGDGTELMISDDGIHVLEQFVLAKYYITTQVYRHRIRLITDQMLVRAICLGIEKDGIRELHELYGYDGSADFAARYAQWDDARFLLHFGRDDLSGTYCQRLLERLRKRQLLKKIYGKRIKELPGNVRETLEQISSSNNREKRAELEAMIHEEIRHRLPSNCDLGDGDSNFVILHSYKFKSVKEQSRDNEGPILVERSPTPKTFEEESALFHSIDASLSEAHVEVYAPIIYDSPAQRRKVLTTLDRPITEILTRLSSEDGETNEDT